MEFTPPPRAALLVALTTPRAGMLMFTLAGEPRDDIIAYIPGLRQSFDERKLGSEIDRQSRL
jgi:hypothetical protein